MERDRTRLNDLADRAKPHLAHASGVIDWSVLEPRLLAAWKTDNLHG